MYEPITSKLYPNNKLGEVFQKTHNRPDNPSRGTSIKLGQLILLMVILALSN